MLKVRSDTTRKIYEDNGKALKWLEEMLNDLDTETSQIIYDALLEVFFDRFRQMDFPVLIEIAEKILPFFEQALDYDRMVRLYSALVYWNMEYYGREAGQVSSDDTFFYVEKTLSCKQYYAQMQDKEARIRIFRTYSNLIGVIADLYHVDRGIVCKWYQDALDFWECDIVRQLDGQDEDFLAEWKWLENSYMEFCYYCVISDSSKGRPEASLGYLSFLRERMAKMTVEQISHDGILLRISYLLQIMDGTGSAEAVLKKIRQYIDSLPGIDFEIYNDEENLNHLDEFFMTVHSAFEFLKLSTMDQNTKKCFVHLLMEKVSAMVQNIPGNIYTDFLNDILAEYFQFELPYLEDLQEKIKELQKLIICRQPMTYVHCYMVELMAEAIGEVMIDHSPQIFVGLPGLTDQTKVLEKRQELLNYLKICGVIHDVGKCKIASVINMQIRRISDKEFQCIRMHPSYGGSILQNDPDFAPYLPVILGHHRSYDGTKGYPESFDNLSTPYKPVIDLISICDSLDAATDIYGRNYAKGKKFDEVLEELIQASGTRYHPEIVRVIVQHQTLRDDLAYLTSEGRSKAYFAAYTECRAMIHEG
ncbi:MAG: HD-GYP domain-containing protein [Acetatifactor sp.]